MRAAVYLRISQDPTGQAAGVTRQREDCIQLVEQQEWDLHEVYIDNDISASSGKARPGYKKMLADIKSGLIDAVVAWHPDRLYRKLADLEGLIEAIDQNNVIMRTVRAGEIDLSTPTGRMLARILGATAQAEGEIKADRWKRSWRQGREAGLPAKTGSRLFGYTRDGKLIPGEAAIARRMVDEVLSGYSIMGISRRLQDEGVETTRGTVWRTSAIRQYLDNPRIAGYSTLKGEIVAEGQWEPLIDRATWENLRAFTAARTRPYAPRVALLNGLVFCGNCQTRLITGQSRGKRLYRCPNRPGFDGCGKVSIYSDVVDQYVEGYAEAVLNDPAVRTRVSQIRAEPAPIQQGLAELDSRVRELEAQLDEPGTPVTTILRAIERAKEKQTSLLAEMAEHQRVPLPEQGSHWPTDLKRRRSLVDLVVERVEVDRSEPGKKSVERIRLTPR